MIISMQGNWTVRVTSKDAAFPQRFVVSGATTGNGTHAGTVGASVAVTGAQWSIAIQHDPGSGFQLSDTKITFPRRSGGNYVFDIQSNDVGADQDFNDLVLTCSTPATINDFIVYGNVTLYSGRCIFNPCRRGPFVIETAAALRDALKNPRLKDVITRLYPERVPGPIDPNPPDPPFKPVVHPRRVGVVHWRRLPESALMTIVGQLIKGAREMRLSRYRTCRFCGRTNPPEWQHGDDVCQCCAVHELGAVH